MKKNESKTENKEIRILNYIEDIIFYAIQNNDYRVFDNKKYFETALRKRRFNWENFSKGIKKDILLHLEITGNQYKIPEELVNEYKVNKKLSHVTCDILNIKTNLTRDLRTIFNNSILEFMEDKRIFIKTNSSYTNSISGCSFHIKPINIPFEFASEILEDLNTKKSKKEIRNKIEKLLSNTNKLIKYLNGAILKIEEDGNSELSREIIEKKQELLERALNNTTVSFQLYKKEKNLNSRNKPLKNISNPLPNREGKFSKSKSKAYTTNPISKNIEKINCSVENENNSSIPNNNY